MRCGWRAKRISLRSQRPRNHRSLSARIGADHLGHSKVSMTQDHYMTRGRVHTQVADLLDRTVAKSGD
jgi:hypothetical protein